MKNNSGKKILGILIIFTMVVALIALGFIWEHEKKYVSDYRDVEKLKIVGEYSLGDEVYHTIPENSVLGLSGHNNVIIKGNFNRDIPVNKLVMMRIDNMRVKIFQNGKEIYSFGERDSIPEYAKSAGNVWDYFVSPGIEEEDEITIELYNVYTDHVESTYTSFLENIYMEYEGTIISYNIRTSILDCFVAVFIICMGIIASGLAFIMFRMGQPITDLLYFVGLSISSGIWFFIDFDVQQYFFPYPVLNNSLDIISLLFTMFFLVSYFAHYLKGKCRILLLGLASTSLILIIVATITQFLGIADYYDYLIVIQSLSILFGPIIAGSFIYEYKKYKSKEMKKILTATIILCIGVMGDAICNMMEITPFLIWFKISYLIFIMIQFTQITQMIRNFMAESARVQILEELAYQDALTGIKNRTAYLEKIDQINANLDSKCKLGVIVLDINNLKVVNDTLGHDYGDRYILSGCEIICKVFDKKEVYRIGGDEFVVILENTTGERCVELGKKLDKEMQENNKYYIGKIKVSLAYGIATYVHGKDYSYQDIFTRADTTMYKKKNEMKQKMLIT